VQPSIARDPLVSPELVLVSTREKAERQSALERLSRFHIPDDGEPDPAEPGRVSENAAPCGRLEPCEVGDCAKCRAAGGRGHSEYLALADELKKLHLLKSGGYGTTRDAFANFSAVGEMTGQTRYVYPVHRAIEKLTRCVSLLAQDRDKELGEEFLDVASLMLCAEAMRREDL
jgi:hypothetical protein